jgi:hypothetical protein
VFIDPADGPSCYPAHVRVDLNSLSFRDEPVQTTFDPRRHATNVALGFSAAGAGEGDCPAMQRLRRIQDPPQSLGEHGLRDFLRVNAEVTEGDWY